MRKIITDVYFLNILTGVPSVSRGATVTEGWTVAFADGGCMSGVAEGKDFWTDEEAAWKANKSYISEKIKFHKKQVRDLTSAYLVKRGESK